MNLKPLIERVDRIEERQRVGRSVYVWDDGNARQRIARMNLTGYDTVVLVRWKSDARPAA